MKKILCVLMLCSVSPLSVALPSTYETAQEVLKTTGLDQTIAFYQRNDDLALLAQAFLEGASDATGEDYSRYQPQVMQLLQQHLQGTEFKTYYEMQLIQPYLELYQEEELVHLLQLYEDPQAQAFFRQSMLSLQDKLLMPSENPREDQRLATQREHKINQILTQLTTKP